MESPEEQPVGKTVHQLLAEVSREIGAIAKARKTDSGAKYNFRGIDDVFDAIHEPLATAGILPLSEILDLEINERVSKGDGGKDRYQTVVILRKRVNFWGPLGDCVSTEAVGEAQDYGDKAVAKAESIAFRTAMIQAFTIPINDAETKIDTETDNSPRSGTQVTTTERPATATTRVTAPKPQSRTATAATSTTPNMRKLFAMLSGIGVGEEQRHSWASKALSREITTFKDLSKEDITLLEKSAKEQQMNKAEPPFTEEDMSSTRPF